MRDLTSAAPLSANAMGLSGPVHDLSLMMVAKEQVSRTLYAIEALSPRLFDVWIIARTFQLGELTEFVHDLTVRLRCCSHLRIRFELSDCAFQIQEFMVSETQ